MHWHERMELLRVVSGEMLLHVGGEQVSRHRMGFRPVTNHPEVVMAVDRLVEILLQKESCALMAVGVVYEIMGTLCQHCLAKEKVQQRVDKGFNQVLEYIENHYNPSHIPDNRSFPKFLNLSSNSSESRYHKGAILTCLVVYYAIFRMSLLF